MSKSANTKILKTTRQRCINPNLIRMNQQISDAGFSGEITTFELGLVSEDTIALLIEGKYKNKLSMVKAEYGMNASTLKIKSIWHEISKL